MTNIEAIDLTTCGSLEGTILVWHLLSKEGNGARCTCRKVQVPPNAMFLMEGRTESIQIGGAGEDTGFYSREEALAVFSKNNQII